MQKISLGILIVQERPEVETKTKGNAEDSLEPAGKNSTHRSKDGLGEHQTLNAETPEDEAGASLSGYVKVAVMKAVWQTCTSANCVLLNLFKTETATPSWTEHIPGQINNSLQHRLTCCFIFFAAVSAVVSVASRGVDAVCSPQYLCSDYTYSFRYTETDCCLTEVPRDIPAGVSTVELHRNAIRVLPRDVFSHLTNCETLTLQENELNRIETGAFNGLRSLEELDLAKNQLSSLEPGLFVSLTALTTLHLSKNRLSSIQNETFSGLGALEVLSLHKNQISSIDSGAFGDLTSLKQLSLEENRLTTLSPHLFSAEGRTIRLSLSPSETLGFILATGPDNPWNCRTLCWLKRKEEERSVVWLQDLLGNAQAPVCADGVTWSSLPCAGEGESISRSTDWPRERVKELVLGGI